MIVLQQEQILTRHTVVTSAKVIEEIGLENMKTFFSNRHHPRIKLIVSGIHPGIKGRRLTVSGIHPGINRKD